MKIAVIPARGGSKRVPRKNIKLFCGEPLISYSIRTALETGLFDSVVVSTDDDEIADIAKSYGANVPFMRPESLSNDHAGTWAVVKHAIEFFSESAQTPDYVCCIYATAPFLQPDYLTNGLELLKAQPEKGFAFSVTTFPFPVLRSIKIDEGEISPQFPEHIYKRSQDLPESYHDAGQFYWGRPQYFADNVTPFSSAGIPVVLPRHLVQDIDTPEDWERAELMYEAYIKSMAKNRS